MIFRSQKKRNPEVGGCGETRDQSSSIIREFVRRSDGTGMVDFDIHTVLCGVVGGSHIREVHIPGPRVSHEISPLTRSIAVSSPFIWTRWPPKTRNTKGCIE